MSLACLLAPVSAVYRRREPETSPLYKAVQGHLETFLATHDVRGHVRRALRRFLGCGVLAKGFRPSALRTLRGRGARCVLLQGPRLLSQLHRAAWRRDTAARLVDDVLPRVRLRQFVLALPFDLHLRASRDGQLQSALLTNFVEELGELLRGLTKTGAEAQGGSVTFVQLFGSSRPCRSQKPRFALVPGRRPHVSPSRRRQESLIFHLSAR